MVEQRYSVEVRAEKTDKGMSLVGYAATFGHESEDLGGFREMIMPGAFARALREGQDVRCLRNHDPNYVLGRTKNGTLQLKEDSRGLFFRCELDPNNPEHVATHSSVSRGDMDACSFAFMPKSQEWSDQRDKDGALYAQRKLHDVDLQDTSVVTYPAYATTSVSARSLDNRNFFDAASSTEIRSALDALAAKRVLEQRGVDVKVTPQAAGAADPGFLPDDLKKTWEAAFEDAYANAIKMHKKGHVAIACAISAANAAISSMVAHAAEVDGEADPTPEPKNLKNIEDDKDPDTAIGEEENPDETVRAHRADCEKRGVHTSQPAEVEGRCPVCRNSASECECDCDDPNCWCQNRNTDAVDVWGDEELLDELEDDENERASQKAARKAAIDTRAKVKTKTVGGKHLPMSAFAFVGDPERTETWKLPIHDEAHVKNALARFNQTQGIPAAKKASVFAKIKAAAKKFNIHVSEENSFDAEAETRKAYERLVAIKTSL
jgi:HK97 family phage prohead protease